MDWYSGRGWGDALNIRLLSGRQQTRCALWLVQAGIEYRQRRLPKSMPTARAAIGTSEWSVRPGTVLASIRYGAPLSSSSRSTRPQPPQSSATNASSASCCSARSRAAGSPQGHR